MTLSNGSTILGTDIEDIYYYPLQNTKTRSGNFTPYKQNFQTFRLRNLSSTDEELYRTITFSPREDCVLRAIRLHIGSATPGETATLTIPAQIVADNVIVGGNIKETIEITATTAASPINSTALYELPNDQLFTLLAGDNIEMVITTAFSNIDITVSLLLEYVLTSK